MFVWVSSFDIFCVSSTRGNSVGEHMALLVCKKSGNIQSRATYIYIYIYVRACMYVNIIRLYVSTYMCYYDISERL